MPAMYADVNDINKYLQYWFIQNNYYVLDAYGNYVYFMEFAYNINRYAVETIFYPMNLPSGGSNPAGMLLMGSTMQLVISSANTGFGKSVGLSQGTYGNAGTSTQSILSNITVEGSPITALNLTCNLVNNSISSSSPNTFYCWTPTGSFGSNLSLTVPELVYIDCYAGRWQQILIEIKDQEGRDVQMKDSTVAIMLCLRSE
jgi:hypothetical protein